MVTFGRSSQRTCVWIAAMVVSATAGWAQQLDVSPLPSTRLPASRTKFVRFHISYQMPAGSHDSVAVLFQPNGASPAIADAGACRIQIDSNDAVRLASGSRSCAVAAHAKASVNKNTGRLEATIPISFHKPGHYRLYVKWSSATGWTAAGGYTMDDDPAAPAPLAVTLLGVTPTQAVLNFTPPAASTTCSVQVTATQNDSGFDYNVLVPDTDPNIFPGADNANLNDPVNAPQNRGFLQPDGSLAIVIGKRAAEYSPITYRTHSRALQALTPHEATITCDDGSTGTIDFTTANIMTGISYADPLPADPDRPGEYAYPTISWTTRNEPAIDPQTGLMMRSVNLPTDSILSPDFSPWTGKFGAAIAAYPAKGFPVSSFFLPANVDAMISATEYSWLDGFVEDQNHPGWGLPDSSLMSFLPTSLVIGCTLCNNTPVTVCLTANGISCAVDRNVTADANATVDPNANVKGVLGITLNCTGNCTFPINDPRWSDTTGMLASWHPNYTSGSPNTVVPSFQFDSVKFRTTPVSCNGSSNVSRSVDSNNNPVGAPFSPLWQLGTPIFIDSVRHTIKQVTDENTIVINEPCPPTAQTLTADTFGLLISAPVPLTGVAPGPWSAQFAHGLQSWDPSGNIDAHTNCSVQPVVVNGKPGWHCKLGDAAYWIAADGSASLPMGATGIPVRRDIPILGNSNYCQPAYFDDLDANSLICLVKDSADPNKNVFAQLEFHGDHVGLENTTYTTPDLGDFRSYLPACKATNPPTPNNCWSVTPMNKTGTSSVFVLQDAVRDAAPAAWASAGFAKAILVGNVQTSLSTKLDANHYLATVWMNQNGAAFSVVLELSQPRGTISVRAVNASWTPPPGAKAYLRWAGIHDPSGAPWGPTKTNIYPTSLSGGAAGGPYYSKVVGSVPTPCPGGASGYCFTIDGQPGVANPDPFQTVDNAATNKPGFGYLQDLAAGDLMCAPQNNDMSHCRDYISWGTFEDMTVQAVATQPDGSIIVNVQRGVGNTTPMNLQAGQFLYMVPNIVDYSSGYGLGQGAIVWDYASGVIEQVQNGGTAHQFSTFDSATQQVLSVTAVANNSSAYSSCYTSNGVFASDCYSLFAGKVDPTKLISSQTAALLQGVITINPPFGKGDATQGLTGTGTPNDVDSHPGIHHLNAAPNPEKTWFVDGRPFNGFYNTALAAPTAVAPNVYRFPASTNSTTQSPLETYKRLPMLGSCGIGVLRDVRTISNQTPYAYCVAVNAGDCTSGSLPGDAYVSCPSVNPAAKAYNACPYVGFGNYTPEVRDTCLTPTGAYTMGLTQVAFATQTNGIWGPLGAAQQRSTRLLTHGLNRYRIVDEYLNAKTTPDGAVLLFRSAFVNGYSTEILMAPIPPSPDIVNDPLDRRGFIPTPITIDPAPDNTDSVKIQFGYDPSFRCISRNEPCEARADFDATGLSTPFYFASETSPAGLSCAGGCPATISLPGISQRVIYYQAVYQVSGSPVPGATHIAVVP